MEPEETATDALKRRLRASLNEQERAVFADLHRELADAVRSGGRSGDPLEKREAVERFLARLQGHALDAAISQNHVLHQVETDLARLEQDLDAATLEQRLAQLKQERREHAHGQDEALAAYQSAASSLVMTVDGARAQYQQLTGPHDRMVLHASEAERTKQQISALKLKRDQLEAERRMVSVQRALEAAAMEKHSVMVGYQRYFAAYNTDQRLLQYVRKRGDRDAAHKEAREEAPRTKKKARGDAHELVSDALCLYRQGQDRMVKFIARDEALLQLYEQLAGASTTAGGFMPVRRVERLDATQAAQWHLCPQVAQSGGAILMETDVLQPLFGDDGATTAATKHADRFAVLYELVHYMQQAAQLLQGFHYGERDARRLMWVARPQVRRYGSLVCASKMGVVMVDLTQAQYGSQSLYLESTDYALFTELARALRVPNFTHKLLGLLDDHARLSYAELLRALATYWSERAFVATMT